MWTPIRSLGVGFLALVVIAAASPAAAAPDCTVPRGALGQDLAQALGGRLAQIRAAKEIALDQPPAARRYALYFGASWCGPCRVFARKLKPIYDSGDPGRLGYEVVFVTRDRGAAEALQYIRREAMPWPFVRPERLTGARAVTQAGAAQAPDLIVVDSQGRIYCSAYGDKGRYFGVFETFMAMRAALA